MDGDIPLLLEIWINGSTHHIITEAVYRKGVLLVDALTLTTAGLKFSLDEIRSDGFVEANALSGVKMQLVESEQRLDISAPSDRLEPQIFNLMPESKTGAATPAHGFMGQYDITGTVDDFSHMSQASSIGATLGGTYFTPAGNLTASGFTQTQNGSGTQTVRLDTAAEKDDPDTLKRWVLGDSVSGSQNWSRSVRFGGFQMATDFSMRPDLSTMPLPAFFGQTALPSSVDVFVNSARVFETNVEPGPFQINNLPIVTGSGDASVVVKNALGQETVVSLPFFASNQLLREGLSSYDFDAGLIRNGYGEQSFDYGQPVAAGTFSEGATNWLTLESHAEAARDVQLAGGGAIFSIGPYGMLHLAAAVSNSNEQDRGHFGSLRSVSFETETEPVGFFGSLNATAGHYADIASIGSTPPPQVQLQVGSHVSLGERGSLAASVIGVEQMGEETSRLLTSTYSLAVAPSWNVGVTGFYDRAHGETVVQAFFSIALGKGLIGDSNVSSGNRIHQEEFGVTQPVNPDGGFGYRLSDTMGDSDIRQGEATWMGTHGSLDGALESTNGRNAGRITASGGIVAMDGNIYTTARPDGSVALVETGQPGTIIYRENRQIAVADDDGKALLTGLVPFAENRISIDPSNYKSSVLIESTDKSVTPSRQSGVMVDFTPVPHFPAVVVLQLSDGSFPPPGARVTFAAGSDPIIVGRHGEIFITDLHSVLEGRVDYEKGVCHFSVSPLSGVPTDTIPRIGPILCQTGQPAL